MRARSRADRAIALAIALGKLTPALGELGPGKLGGGIRADARQGLRPALGVPCSLAAMTLQHPTLVNLCLVS